MKPVKVDPLSGALNFLSALGESFVTGKYGNRNTALNNKLDNGIIVDTVLAADTELWETGIKKPDYKWIIVEQYEDAEKAAEGHNKWVKLLSEEPDFPIKRY